MGGTRQQTPNQADLLVQSAVCDMEVQLVRPSDGVSTANWLVNQLSEGAVTALENQHFAKLPNVIATRCGTHHLIQCVAYGLHTMRQRNNRHQLRKVLEKTSRKLQKQDQFENCGYALPLHPHFVLQLCSVFTSFSGLLVHITVSGSPRHL